MELLFRLLGRLTGAHRLERVEMIELRATIAHAIEVYGEPLESSSSEGFDAATAHEFAISRFHCATVIEWNELVHGLTYWSLTADPGRDLDAMFRFYGQGDSWCTLTAGYAYVRSDRTCHLWCSAMPAIGVESTEYRDARLRHKRSGAG